MASGVIHLYFTLAGCSGIGVYKIYNHRNMKQNVTILDVQAPSSTRPYHTHNAQILVDFF